MGWLTEPHCQVNFIIFVGVKEIQQLNSPIRYVKLVNLVD